MIFTPSQIQELLFILQRQNTIFIANNLGKDVLSPVDKAILKQHGIDISKLPKKGVVDNVFRFGILAKQLGKQNVKKMGFSQFKKYLEEGKYLPLSKEQEYALNTVKQRMYGDVKGLGNKIEKDVNTVFVEKSKENRKKYENILKKELEEGVLENKTVNQIASELGHKTKDWARDFGRIADYVLHEAYDTGVAMAIMHYQGENARVYKEVYPGACEHCQSLYLTNGIGSKPKEFKLGKLMDNGTNIGRKTNEWKPVIGSTHPWCRCELYDIPVGYEWDEQSKSYQPVRQTYGVKRKSKAKITIS